MTLVCLTTPAPGLLRAVHPSHISYSSDMQRALVIFNPEDTYNTHFHLPDDSEAAFADYFTGSGLYRCADWSVIWRIEDAQPSFYQHQIHHDSDLSTIALFNDHAYNTFYDTEHDPLALTVYTDDDGPRRYQASAILPASMAGQLSSYPTDWYQVTDFNKDWLDIEVPPSYQRVLGMTLTSYSGGRFRIALRGPLRVEQLEARHAWYQSPFAITILGLLMAGALVGLWRLLARQQRAMTT